MAASDALKLILREVQRIPGSKKSTNSNINVCCPFHKETGPSCGIYIIPNGGVPVGWFYCFGCGETGPWNKLAEKAGLNKLDNGDFKVTDTAINSGELTRKRNALLPKRDRIKLPYGIPFNDDWWRHVDGDIVRAVGGTLGFDAHSKMAALYLPINVRGETVGVIKAALEKQEGKLSYVIMEGNAQVKQKGLFPYDYVEEMLKTGDYCYVTLVEGSRDALRLISKGIPALAIIATTMWSVNKRRLVLSLCRRYDVLPLVMMDADKVKSNGEKPGQKAQREIVADLRKHIDCQQIKLEPRAKALGLEELDPAQLPLWLYRDIRNLVRRKET